MAKHHQLTKGELRTPDTLTRLGDQLLGWLERNFVLVTAVLGGSLVAGLGWLAYDRIDTWYARRAFTDVDQAVSVYHRPTGAEGGGEATLESLKQETEGGPHAKRYPTEEARAEAVMKLLDSGSGTVPDAKGAGLVGGFYKGLAESGLGKHKEAAEVFTKIEADKPAWQPLDRLVRYNRAVELSDQGAYEDAAKAFLDVVADGTGDLLRAEALHQAGLDVYKRQAERFAARPGSAGSSRGPSPDTRGRTSNSRRNGHFWGRGSSTRRSGG